MAQSMELANIRSERLYLDTMTSSIAQYAGVSKLGHVMRR